MRVDAQTLFEQVLTLGQCERADFAARLLESLDGPKQEGVDEAWNREIAQRIAEIDRGSVELVPWEQASEIIFGAPHES